MPTVLIHNLLPTRLVLPVGPALAPRGQVRVSLSVADLESAAIVALERAGHVSIEPVQDDAVGDALEFITRADLNSIGTVDVSLSAEVANVITVTCAIVDLAGRALADQRHVMVRTIADSDDQGDIGETVSPIGSVFNIKDDSDGVASSAWIRTSPEGTFDFTVTNANAEGCAVFIAADNCLARVVQLTFT
jgi:hypothetical protein